MRFLTASAAISAAGILIVSSGYALSILAPWLSKESCYISVAQSGGDTSPLGIQACTSRFAQEVEPVQLSDFYLGLIEGRAGFSGSLLDARLYNGGDYTVTKLRVAVTDPSTSDDDEPATHYYDIITDIPPFSTQSISKPTFLQYEKVVWQIVSAWGTDSER